jgi:colanic acid/amylovoran biosynthesis glycosyltransferase
MPNPASVEPVAPARRLVASYIVTFLKPEMLHIYRQVRRLERWETVVLCQKRENASAFPFEQVQIIPKPRTHQLRRWWQKTVRGRPITIYPSEARYLRRRLVQLGADLLHIYFGHIAVHLLPLLEILPIPVVVSFHGADAQVDLDKPIHRDATKRMLERVRLVLTRSTSLAEHLVQLGCPRAKIRIHRTGIPIQELQFRQRVAPEDGAWRCVQASRLIEKKGLFTTLSAFARFAERFPKAKLTFAGDGPLREATWQEVVHLGLADRVKFNGFLSQPELRALYDQSHFFLHPSETPQNGDQEGVPNAMLEAMAMGLPVLATTHGGIPEAVEHGVSGILVPERDHERLGSELCALAADPARYAGMSQAAAARVQSMFDLRATVGALEGFYDEALRPPESSRD